MIKIFINILLLTNIYAQNVFLGEHNDQATINALNKNTLNINKSDTATNRAKTELSLSEIYKKIDTKKRNINSLKAYIAKTENKDELELLQIELTQENDKLEELKNSFAQQSVGSVNIDDLKITDDVEDINLDKSISDMFEPIAIMVTRMTNKPRKIEHLNLDIQITQSKLDKLDEAINNLKSYKLFDVYLQAEIAILIHKYTQQKLLLMHKLNSYNMQLNKLLKNDADPMKQTILSIKNMFKTHGLNIVYATLVFALSFSILFFIKWIINFYYKSNDHNLNQVFSQRLLNLVLSILAVFIAIISFLITLYSLSDWIVLILFILIFAITFWSIKTNIPKYYDEIKITLNIGNVRENERLLYNGIPYILKQLGLYATIDNDVLSNAKTRLPLSQLDTLTSRALTDNESLFPTKVGDFIFIDNKYGSISFQSPEIVEINTLSTAVLTYQTKSFLSAKPINLSKNGFLVSINIGLDLKHQAEITSSVKLMLEKSLKRSINIHPFSNYLEKIWVDFNQAKIDSLELKIFAKFSGEAASEYYGIKRLLNTICIDTCNNNGWVLAQSHLIITKEQ